MPRDIDPNPIANAIRNKNRLIFLESSFRLYRKGVYRPIYDLEMKKIIKNWCRGYSRIKLIDEVYTALSIDCHKKQDEIIEQADYLNVMNGMLRVKKGNLSKHSPAFNSMFQFPVDFDRKSQCPLFLKTVKDWFEGDMEKVQLLQEYLGYCLMPGTGQGKMLFLIGEGANGKSTLLHVIQSVFGKENCSAISLSNFSQRFHLARLRGKLVNLTSETPSKSVLCDDIIKQIVTGDPITGEEKYKPPFDFIPTAKLIIACNEMPRTEDKTDAIYRRLLILRFNRKYSDRERDENLSLKLAKEKNGIFLWCYIGLLRLQKRGRFLESQESIAERENYRKENNSVIRFVEEACVLDPLSSMTKDKIFRLYADYCAQSLLHPMTKHKFGKELKRQYQLAEQYISGQGNRSRGWTGIKCNFDSFAFFEN